MNSLRVKLDDVLTEIAVDLVVALACRAVQFGIVITDDLRDRLIDEIAVAVRQLG